MMPCMLASAIARHAACTIRVGTGSLKEMPATLRADRVQRVLLLTSVKGHERIGRFLAWLLQSQGMQVIPYAMAHGDLPAVKFVDEARVVAARTGCHAVVAAGGGAALDVGKLVAACVADDTLLADLRTASEEPERIGRGEMPFYAVPTHFGTGSELNGDVVVLENATGEALPLQSPHLRAAGVFVDKENFAGLSAANIHYGAVSAAAHGICNAATAHIREQQRQAPPLERAGGSEGEEEEPNAVGLAAEAVLYAQRVLLDDSPSSKKDVDTCYELAYGSIAAGFSANVTADAESAGDGVVASNAALLRTVCGAMAEHSKFSYSEAVYAAAPALLQRLVTVSESDGDGDCDDNGDEAGRPRFDRTTWGVPEATAYWHGVDTILGEKADERLLGVARPTLTAEQAEAVASDAVAVAAACPELDALPPDVKAACLAKEALDDVLVRPRGEQGTTPAAAVTE